MNRVDNLSLVLQALSLEILFKDYNNCDLMNELQRQDKEYLDNRYQRQCHYSKTIGEFAKEFPYGKYALTMNGHITALIDGVIIDSFDPRNRVMRCAWKIDV